MIDISNSDFCREQAREDKKRDRDEDEEDVYERRRLERRLRDKEAAYQEVGVHADMVKVTPVDLHHLYTLITSTLTETGIFERLYCCSCVINALVFFEFSSGSKTGRSGRGRNLVTTAKMLREMMTGGVKW